MLTLTYGDLSMRVAAALRSVALLAAAVRVVRLIRACQNRPLLDRAAVRFLLRCKRYTQVSWERLANVYVLCRMVEQSSIPGAFVECGVWRGGCAAVMGYVAARSKSGRKVWLFDSFEGMPEASEEDRSDDPRAIGLSEARFTGDLVPIGSNVAELEDVKHTLFSELRLPPDNIIIQKGWFQQALPPCKGSLGPISVLRLDGDWYESTKVCLENLYDLVVTNGYVIIDDYGSFIGCRRAVDEFLAARNLSIRLQQIDRDGVFFQKP